MAQVDRGTSSGEELLTLSEVSNRTEISMPTLQRYKKNYQNRIPSVGRGRTQRYPESALAIFEEIKQENLAKRGRPRKEKAGGEDGGARSGRGRRAGGRRGPARRERKTPARAQSGGGLLTLTEVADRTGISYPTLVRYVKLHGNRIPFEGKGRSRRYHPEAVAVFQQIRSESPRGRRKGSGKKASAPPRALSAVGGDAAVGRRLQALESAHDRLVSEIRELVKHLKKPMTATFHRR